MVTKDSHNQVFFSTCCWRYLFSFFGINSIRLTYDGLKWTCRRGSNFTVGRPSSPHYQILSFAVLILNLAKSIVIISIGRLIKNSLVDLTIKYFADLTIKYSAIILLQLWTTLNMLKMSWLLPTVWGFNEKTWRDNQYQIKNRRLRKYKPILADLGWKVGYVPGT